jgi:hypothetical protein
VAVGWLCLSSHLPDPPSPHPLPFRCRACPTAGLNCWNEGPIRGCQIGTKCPFLHARLPVRICALGMNGGGGVVWGSNHFIARPSCVSHLRWLVPAGCVMRDCGPPPPLPPGICGGAGIGSPPARRAVGAALCSGAAGAAAAGVQFDRKGAASMQVDRHTDRGTYGRQTDRQTDSCVPSSGMQGGGMRLMGHWSVRLPVCQSFGHVFALLSEPDRLIRSPACPFMFRQC